MRRKIFGVPIIAVLVAVFIPIAIAAAAYTIVTMLGTYTVTEPIGVSPSSWNIGSPGSEFYAGETNITPVTLTNSGTQDIDITMIETITGPSPLELTVTFPKNITVSGGGSAVVNVSVEATQSIVPGEYTISVATSR